jgi:two-component system chemotaxis response regulator CheB
MKTRVLVVDDSALMRGILTQMINLAPDMEVVGSAPDAPTAREMIKATEPHVQTLPDVQMPQMDGIEFLDRLMPCSDAVVMDSSFTEPSESTLRALELVAVDFIASRVPRRPEHGSLCKKNSVEKIRAARMPRMRRYSTKMSGAPTPPAEPAARAAPGRLANGGSSSSAPRPAHRGSDQGVPPRHPGELARRSLIVRTMPRPHRVPSRAGRTACVRRAPTSEGNEGSSRERCISRPVIRTCCKARAGRLPDRIDGGPGPVTPPSRPSVDVQFDSAASWSAASSWA